jgi:hypothetical protein
MWLYDPTIQGISRTPDQKQTVTQVFEIIHNRARINIPKAPANRSFTVKNSI